MVGRFLNPDNFVQQPGNTQSYNRYSYCLNNPLKYTDPSGQLSDGWMGVFEAAGNYLINVASYKSANDCGWGEAFSNATFGVNINYNSGTHAVSTPGVERYKQATSNHQVKVNTQGSAQYEPYKVQDMIMPVLVASANGDNIPIYNAFSFGIGGGMPYKEGAIASSFGFFKGATSQGLYFQTKRSKSPFIFGISYDFTLYESLNNDYVHLFDLNDKGTELELGAWIFGFSESSNAFLFDDGFYINPTYRAHTGGYTEGAQFGAAEWETNTRVIPMLPWIGLLY